MIWNSLVSLFMHVCMSVSMYMCIFPAADSTSMAVEKSNTARFVHCDTL